MSEINPLLPQQPEIGGLLGDSLLRSGSSVKKDRASQLFRNLERAYRRKVEDLGAKYQNLVDKRIASFDMSPADINSLKMPLDISPEEFVDNDLKLVLQIRDLEIELTAATKAYEDLFKAKSAEA